MDTTKDPVRKHSLSSTDGANTSVAAAPQLKIDANGMLVVDEERYNDNHFVFFITVCLVYIFEIWMIRLETR